MNFNLNKTIDILQRTPAVLESLLLNVSDEWAFNNEGPDTFSPFDVLGHLIHGEKTDWITRLEIMLSEKSDKTFQPYDRFAQFTESRGKTINQLLSEFHVLRKENIQKLYAKNLQEKDFVKSGIHPVFGLVNVHQLLATWTVHDLGHIAQITRVMSKHYKQDVGPWLAFLPVLTRH